MKKIILSLLLTVFALSLWASKEIIQEPLERCDANTFSIMPWGSHFSEGDIVDLDNFCQDIYECGFNLTGFMPADKISLAKKYNLMSSVMSLGMIDGNIQDKKERFDDWAKKTKTAIGEENLDNVYQVYVRDEPNVSDIPDLVLMCDSIRKYVGVRPYVNLFPTYASPYHFDGLSLDEYYYKVVNDCKLDYLSYDNYSLFTKDGLNEDRFYRNLELASKVSREKKIDFVNIILSMAHFNYAVPNEYSINVQGWSTLAYGAKGLSYFLFHNANRGNYRGGAFDRYGSRTPLWYIIRNMNFAIHNIMPYYKDLTYVNTYHYGNVPKGSKDIKSAQCVQGIEATVSTTNSKLAIPFKNNKKIKPNLVIGEFIGKDRKQYAIIVNKDPDYSVWVKKVDFFKGTKTIHIQDYSVKNKECSFTGEDGWIAPGYGIMLRAD